MGSTGILITGQGGLIEKVVADSNAGGGFVVAGSVIESLATRNGTFGILAIKVRDCLATDNHNVDIQLDGSGGVGTGNIASFRQRRYVCAQWHSDRQHHGPERFLWTLGNLSQHNHWKYNRFQRRNH
jgi:hypothetical protein